MQTERQTEIENEKKVNEKGQVSKKQSNKYNFILLFSFSTIQTLTLITTTIHFALTLIFNNGPGQETTRMF